MSEVDPASVDVWYSALHDQLLLRSWSRKKAMTPFDFLYGIKNYRKRVQKMEPIIDAYDITLGRRDGWLIKLGSL